MTGQRTMSALSWGQRDVHSRAKLRYPSDGESKELLSQAAYKIVRAQGGCQPTSAGCRRWSGSKVRSRKQIRSFLPLATCRDVLTTGGTSALRESSHFVEGGLVNAEEETHYDQPVPSEETTSLYPEKETVDEGRNTWTAVRFGIFL